MDRVPHGAIPVDGHEAGPLDGAGAADLAVAGERRPVCYAAAEDVVDRVLERRWIAVVVLAPVELPGETAGIVGERLGRVVVPTLRP
jgi:hypothetical protein